MIIGWQLADTMRTPLNLDELIIARIHGQVAKKRASTETTDVNIHRMISMHTAQIMWASIGWTGQEDVGITPY